ncbi:hypothetical protein OG568_01885 [Streptomyces sp. NBC_01450]|uniref:hypothetical protein n=1 Tax=Streptomyces sp. NBC_01450 TaxID=2903871 RepID=UPI002E2F366D|nr:hypothetical protein [Streptomyces sp. NBC_01450]
MEREELVERAADPGDGRSQLVRLTPETRSVGRSRQPRALRRRRWAARPPVVRSRP